MDVNTITMRTTSMTHPVAPGPERKLKRKNPLRPVPVAFARRTKFTMWAIVWTQEKKTIDHAMSLWNVMFLSKSMTLFNGVRRRREIRPRQTAINQNSFWLGNTEEDKSDVNM